MKKVDWDLYGRFFGTDDYLRKKKSKREYARNCTRIGLKKTTARKIILKPIPKKNISRRQTKNYRRFETLLKKWIQQCAEECKRKRRIKKCWSRCGNEIYQELNGKFYWWC